MARGAAPDACLGPDLAVWEADAKIAALKPKMPATDNRKPCAILGARRLGAPLKFVGGAAALLKVLGHLGWQRPKCRDPPMAVIYANLTWGSSTAAIIS